MNAKWFLRALAVVATATSFASCDKGGEEPIPTPEFPDKETINVEAGDRGTFAFDANMDWELTVTNGTWLRLVANDQDEAGFLDTSGKAGENIEVKYFVADAGQGVLSSDTATVELTMGGENNVVFEVVRAGAQGKVTMYIKDAVSGEISEAPEDFVLAFTYNDRGRSEEYYTIGFAANFNWQIEMPEGLRLTPNEAWTGGVADQTQEEVEFREVDWTDFPFEYNGNIVVSDQTGTHKFEFPVTYAGMGDEDVLFSAGFGQTKAFKANGDITVGATTAQSVTGSVSTKNLEYDIYVVKIDLSTFSSADITGTPESEWLNIEDNEGEITISVDANEGAARNAYIAIVPKSMTTPDWSDVEAAYGYISQQRKGFQVTQEQFISPVTSGFYVKWTNGGSVVNSELIKATDMLLGMIPAEYNVPADNTYMFLVNNASWINNEAEDYFLKGGPLFVAPVSEFESLYCKAMPVDSSTGWNGETAIMLSDPLNTDNYTGVRVDALTRVSGGDKMGVLLFYDDQTAYENGGEAVAALVIQIM
jgi:hypothetical protein